MYKTHWLKKIVSINEQDEAKTTAVLAEFEVLEAEEQYRISQLELERVIEVLNLRSIRSPIDGVVVELFKSSGEFVEEQPIVKIVQINPLNVEVIAPLSWLKSIKAGMKAKLTIERPIGGTYEAEVKIVDPVVDAASGTFGIRLELPNPGHKIFAGLRCKIKKFMKGD